MLCISSVFRRIHSRLTFFKSLSYVFILCVHRFLISFSLSDYLLYEIQHFYSFSFCCFCLIVCLLSSWGYFFLRFSSGLKLFFVFSFITNCPKVKYHLLRMSWTHLHLHLAKMMQKRFLVRTPNMMKLERYCNAD